MKSLANAIVITAALVATLPSSCTNANAQAYRSPLQTQNFNGKTVQHACSSLMNTLLNKYGRTFLCVEISDYRMPNFTERSGNIGITDNLEAPQSQRFQMHFNTLIDPTDPNAYTYSKSEFQMFESMVASGRGLTYAQMIDAGIDHTKAQMKHELDMYATMPNPDPVQLKERKKYYTDSIKQLEALRVQLHKQDKS